jgi:hypothetical protein
MTAEEMQQMAIPSVFAEVVWGKRPYDWQRKIMNPMLVPGNRVVAATCNESGKTSEIITKTGLWYMMAFPGCVVVSTSASSRQIGQQLYPNIRACVKELADGENWRVKDANDRYEVKAPNGSCWFSFTTKDAGRAEGYHVPALHAPIHADKELPDDYNALVKALKDDYEFELKDETRLLLIIDEAKSVEEDIFQAFERCRGTNWMVLSTPPTDPTGPFYDCFKTQKEKFRCKETGDLLVFGGFGEDEDLITYKKCPHLLSNKHVVRDINLDIKTRGHDDAFVGSMHFGRFPSIGQNMVFNMQRVREAMSGLNRRVGRDLAFACDYSGGGDETVLVNRKGNDASIAATWRERDSTVLVTKIISMLGNLRFDRSKHELIGDDGGLGQPINDQLEARMIRTDRFDFGGGAREPKKYGNVRAEGFFFLSKLINLGEIRLPDDKELYQQLEWVTYLTDENNRRRLTPKDKMPHSPDRADAMMMLFYEFEELEITEEEVLDIQRSPCRGGTAYNPEEDGDFNWIDSEGLLC